VIYREFLRQHEFAAGTYDVRAIGQADAERPLLSLRFAVSDTEGVRHLPELVLPASLKEQDRRLVLSAAVRAGAEHPGLRDEDLSRLHRTVVSDRHIELFTDLNALTTGLLKHLTWSLGAGVGRVVISSSSIDVLHEHQSKTTGQAAHLQRNEMARALRVLDDVREHAPVHVHQLPPGAARYFQRGSAGPVRSAGRADPLTPADDGEFIDDEQRTYIAEDRQMIGAYWHYITTSNPRLPVYLVTSDFALAHVCAVERVPFLFARSPHDSVRVDARTPRSLWYDPFAMTLRFALPHKILWELCLVYRHIVVSKSEGETAEVFQLSYDPRAHQPGGIEDISKELPSDASRSEKDPKPGDRDRTRSSKTRSTSGEERRIKLSMSAIVDVLPTRPGQRVPLTKFKPKDEDALRQLRLVGEQTGLFVVEDESVLGATALDLLLKHLQTADYIGVNAIFRRVPPYDRVIQDVASGANFPSSSAGGALTGWAIILGAAYRSREGVRYGLAEVTDRAFEAAVVRAHAEIGGGAAAVSLPDILDRTCLALQLSPVRFEALLSRCLGRGGLRSYEAHRATIDEKIPSYPVLVVPASAEPSSYTRTMEPGKGVLLDGKLVSSIVKRPEDSSS
jgi:hypothetical protein